MDGIKIDYPALAGKAGELKALSSQMQTILENVTSEFNKVNTENVWIGDSATEVRGKLDALSNRFSEFSKAVEECSTYLNSVVENYQSGERTYVG